MSHSALRRHGVSLAAAAAVTVGAMALAGCGAGQITQTSTQVSAVDGASATVGQVAIRNASIVFASAKNAAIYPAGGTAPLQMSIVNFGNVDDRLVSASSAVAGSVKISGDPRVLGGRTLRISSGAQEKGGPGTEGGGVVTPPAGATPTAGAPKASTSASASASPSASASTSPSASASASASATPSATPTPSADGTTSASLVLTGLKQDIRAGLTYPVQFTFEKAGQVTVQVPVANPSEPRSAGSA